MATIDLNRISTFVRVVESGSFTAAATALGLPTSSVSRAVARLEEELGVRLLHRTTRSLGLTDGGRHFFSRMQTVVQEAEAAAAAISGEASQPRGVVRVTAPVDLGLQQLPAIVGGLIERHPGLVIELVLTSRRLDLVEEGIDLAIRGGHLEDSSLMVRKIGMTDLGIFAAPAYLARRGQPRRLADLARHACLVYGGRGGRMPWRFTGPRGEESVVVSGPVVCDDMSFLHRMALDGVGLVLMPVPTAAGDVKDGRLVRVLPRHRVEGGGLYIVWPPGRLVPARVTLVREWLAAELSKFTSLA